MNFKVGQVFETDDVRITIIRMDKYSLSCKDEYLTGDPQAEFFNKTNNELKEHLLTYKYKEIPQKSSNFRDIYNILNNE
jgi:hypothetical protein